MSRVPDSRIIDGPTDEEVEQLMRILGYAAIYALLDMFPISWYGQTSRERLKSLAASLGSSLPAMMNVGMVMIFVATLAIVIGLYRGATQWVADYVNGNPMVRTLEVAALAQERITPMTPDAVASFRELKLPRIGPNDPSEIVARKRESQRKVIQAAHGWNDLFFLFKDMRLGKGSNTSNGRSVDPKDPVLGRLEYVWRAGNPADPPFHGDGVGQIILLRKELTDLGYEWKDTSKPPPPIRLDEQDGSELEVVGVCERLFPGMGNFLITERFHELDMNRAVDLRPRFTRVELGPIPERADPEPWLAALKAHALQPSVKVDLGVSRDPDGHRWLDFTRETAWDRDSWYNFLTTARNRVGGASATMTPRFGKELPRIRPLPEGWTRTFTRVSIYVNRLEDVVESAQALQADGYKLSGEARDIAALFLQVNGLSNLILAGVLLIVGSLTSVSLGLSIAQSIERKAPEIAILKAFGAESKIILTIYLMEAAVIAGLASALGTLLARSAAPGLNRLLAELVANPAAQSRLSGEFKMIEVDSTTSMIASLLALLLCLGVTGVSGGLAARLRPADALRGR